MGQYKTLNNFASEYSASATYAVGDLCMRLGELYRCTTAIAVAEAWNGAHWSQTSVKDLDGSVPYITTAPSANNTSGRLIIVVLSSEPATKYDGYLYIITGSN